MAPYVALQEGFAIVGHADEGLKPEDPTLSMVRHT
ncbi:hypothetical protein ALO35_200040 [Pseudomonas amygdali pv. lachrymans]|uniref:Uncharacterized protein n=2 Tax=Pseudomonas amygdali TaxID=47877 RepID=A0A3M6GQU0_PSEAJ|nr:hypothetical protein ALO35_200040 [Pseudomonas amygdali pv. lachrymans]RMV94844.1 hypothetical protein ALP03_200069 [Pseudomonas amygdali pv. tabaci]